MPARISIVIPAYQPAAYLAAAIASALAECPHECILVDDGSQSNAIAATARLFPQVKYLRLPHAGAAAARHQGAKAATGDYILFLDSDDLLQPGALAHFQQAITKHPGAVAVYARLQTVDENGTPFDAPRPQAMPAGRALLCALLEKEMLLYNGAICIRRDALLALDAQNEAFPIGEDWMLWCHLALAGDIIPAGQQVVLHYRRHAHNASARLLENPAPMFAAIDALFAHPAFKTALGEGWQATRDTCHARMHAYLASAYAKSGNRPAAQSHLAQGARYLHQKSPYPLSPERGEG